MVARVLVALMLLAGGAVVWLTRPAPPPTAQAVAAVSADDAGDRTATTSYDGAMVRRRAAIAVHPAPGASRARIAREIQSAATAAGLGRLEPATFAVFSAEMLEYLVPEMTFVAPEDVTVAATEAVMRDHQPADVAFYLVQPVLVQDLTFAVITAPGVSPAGSAARADAEGILSDSLGRYRTVVQKSGVTWRYFGAILSDAQIGAVRDSIGRAAGVPGERVQVSAGLPGPGVDLSGGVPHLTDDEASHHHR